jgi:uroporphyrinogen decarboxylase
VSADGAASGRFLRACAREPVDATPVWFMRQAGRALREYRRIRETATLEQIVGDAALCAEVTLQPVRRLGVDAAILFADITTPLRGIGLDVRLVDGVGPVIDEPIRSDADIDRLRAFDAHESVGPLLEAIRLLRRDLASEHGVPLVGFAGAPFTLASYLVEGRASQSAIRLRTLMSIRPDFAGRLLGTLTDMTIAYLRAQADAGAQALQVFDSWVGTLSVATYEAAVAPHMRRLFDALADLDIPVIHFATGNPALLPSMARAGGSVIGVDWRIPLDEAWRSVTAAVGPRAVQGNLDPVALLAPWDSAAAAATAVLREARGRPGHVFNLGHGVLPETDPDQLRRLVDLVHAWPIGTHSDQRVLATAQVPA